MRLHQSRGDFLRRAASDVARGFDPRVVLRRPQMFSSVVVAVTATVLAVLWPQRFAVVAASLLWLFALTMSLGVLLVEARGASLTEGLRHGRAEVLARRVRELRRDAASEMVKASRLRRGDLVLVVAGETVPADGVVVAGLAAVKASFVGGSGPLVREPGAERRSVAAGALVLSDWLILDVWSNPGEDLRERLCNLLLRTRQSVECSWPAFASLVFGLMLVGLVAGAALHPWLALVERTDVRPMMLLLVLLTCLLPTMLAGLELSLDLAGLRRLMHLRVLTGTVATLRAVETADVLVLEQASVASRMNCKAVDFVPVSGTAVEELAEAAFLASLADETPEGRSIVGLAVQRFGVVPGELAGAKFLPYSEVTRLVGVDVWGRKIRKGEAEAVAAYHRDESSSDLPDEVRAVVQRISSAGASSLVIADGGRVLGVVRMESWVVERLARLRRRGVWMILASAGAPAEAAKLAAEAKFDDFLAEATPEAKLALVGRHQALGRRVAMVGDGDHDGPALARADVSIACNAGSQAAREAGTLVDLDADPTKIIAVLEAGRELNARRRTLYRLAVAFDVVVCVAVVPIVVEWTCLGGHVDMLGLRGPESAALAGLLVHTIGLAVVLLAAGSEARVLRCSLATVTIGATLAFVMLSLFDRALFSLLSVVL